MARFGDNERQRSRLIRKLVELPVIDNKDIASTRDYVDDLIATVRAMEKFGVDKRNYGTVILPVIESKLPAGWQLQWNREKEISKEWSFDKLLSFLEREIRIRLSVEVGGRGHRKDQHNNKPGGNSL
jgi:hypothetical protein